MRKLIFALAASAALSAPAAALEWGFGASAGIGGVAGFGKSFSGASNVSNAFKTGNSSSLAESQSFGQAESAFGFGLGTMPDGSNAAGAFGNFVGGSVASGSMSQANTKAQGTGFASASTAGVGYSGTVLKGAAFGLGGFVAGGN